MGNHATSAMSPCADKASASASASAHLASPLPRHDALAKQTRADKMPVAALPADIEVEFDRPESINLEPLQWKKELATTPGFSVRRIEQFYDVSMQRLGRGHYATVNYGRCKRSGRAVAVKKIKRFLTDEARLRTEIAVLQHAGQHPNIVQLLDVFETPREVQLVLEHCAGGELFARLAEKGPYSEADCVRHMRDMARAVQHLHEHGIVHRDLKPENILLSSRDDADAMIKVADFGLAKLVTGIEMKTKCGTWGYSAPEMISGSGYAFGYDHKVDSWSLGTILYILLCGFHPFDPNGTFSDNEMVACIKQCRFAFDDPAWEHISHGAKDLVCRLLVLDPDARYSVKDLLQHPWITGAIAPASEFPLSPMIHRDLAKFREKVQRKNPFEDEDDEDDEERNHPSKQV